MKVAETLTLVARLAIVLVTAILAGLAVTFGCAIVGGKLLVWRYGENLAPIDDTLPMLLAVWTAYLAGLVTGLIVLAVGAWRLVLRHGRGDVRASESPRD